MHATKEREEKFHHKEIIDANKTMRESMRDTLNMTKQIGFVKAKGDIETAALRKAKNSTRQIFTKPMISDMIVSRSTSVCKSTINKQTKDRLFGGIPLYYPEGTPLIQLLELLSEEQLYRLNQKICNLY